MYAGAMKEKLWICDQEWDFEVDSERLVDDDHGEADSHIRKIHITKKARCDESIRITALHETVHAIVKSVCDGWKPDEEAGVTAMTTGLYSVLRSPKNLWLLKFLTEGVFDVRLATAGKTTVKHAQTTRRKSATCAK